MRASEIIRELACPSCDRIVVETSGRLRACLGGHIIDRKKVSSSTLQQIRFAVRMAAGEVLAGGRNCRFCWMSPLQCMMMSGCAASFRGWNAAAIRLCCLRASSA